jgi:hypothetical protein
VERSSRGLIKGPIPFSGGAEENNENICQESWCTGQDLNQEPPRYKSEALLLEATLLDAAISFSYKMCSKTDFVFS